MVISAKYSGGKSSGNMVNLVNNYQKLPNNYQISGIENKTNISNISSNKQINNEFNNHLPELPELPRNSNKENKWKQLLMNEDVSLVGQMFEHGRWISLDKIPEPVSRSICDNEIVFDIDGDDWDSARKLAVSLESVLDQLEIPFIRFTSGRLLHYSVFVSPYISFPSNEMIKDYFTKCGYKKYSMNDVAKLGKSLKYALFLYISHKLPKISGAKLDDGLMASSRHLIRMCGAKNGKTGYFKSYLPELPVKQAMVTEDNVKYPETIEYLSDIPDDLLFMLYDKYVDKADINAKFRSRNGKIKWVDKLIKKGISDGRHRTIDLIIVPYLVSLGYSDKDIIEIVLNWYDRCKKVKPATQVKYNYGKRIIQATIDENYVLKKARYVRKKGLKVMSRKNAKWLELN